MQQVALGISLVVAVGAVVLRLRNALRRRRGLERLSAAEAIVRAPPHGTEPLSGVSRWLYLAGYRSPRATFWFAAWTVLGGLCGGLVLAASGTSRVYRLAASAIDGLPGGVGALLAPIWHAGPWFVAIVATAAPTLVVRWSRRRRITQVERDLPVTLELLATLAESGLGFDAALSALQRALHSSRVLAEELRAFQADLLAGRGRVECLRRLAWRVDVPSLTVVVSALVQAEQVGAGIAETLRHQSDDLRNRRRMLALERSMSLPVKLMFPLVVCFLPGLFVFTLGPAYAQFFQYADALIRVREFSARSDVERPTQPDGLPWQD